MALPVCRHCRRPFRPDPRIGKSQKACSRVACQRARRRNTLRLWRILHPENVKVHAQRARAWTKAHAPYWRQYRRDHPAYYQRDLARRRKAYRSAILSANEIAIAQISRRKLAALEALQAPVFSANETSIDRRINAVVDYLVWKARSAKEIAMEPAGPGSG
jgi:hypothetical protein